MQIDSFVSVSPDIEDGGEGGGIIVIYFHRTPPSVQILRTPAEWGRWPLEEDADKAGQLGCLSN